LVMACAVAATLIALLVVRASLGAAGGIERALLVTFATAGICGVLLGLGVLAYFYPIGVRQRQAADGTAEGFGDS
jgi:hypothetical protein